MVVPWVWPQASINERGSTTNWPDQTAANACANCEEETAVKKPSPPTLMPRMRVFEPATSRATRSMVPSPPNTRIKSACCRSWRASGLTATFSLARSAVALSLETLRPASAINAAAFCTAARQFTFSALAMRPTRLILSAKFFKQSEEFLVAGRSEQRRFGHAAPAQGRAAVDKRLHLAQHP